MAVIRSFIKQEAEKRRDFAKNIHTYLPSQFCPALRDQAPELILDGPSSEVCFADVRDAIRDYEDLVSPFQRQNNSPASPGEGAGDRALRSELNLQSEEYMSNLREKEATIQKLQI